MLNVAVLADMVLNVAVIVVASPSVTAVVEELALSKEAPSAGLFEEAGYRTLPEHHPFTGYPQVVIASSFEHPCIPYLLRF